jgi:uncharacterized repeat protein (TIGR03803 family)
MPGPAQNGLDVPEYNMLKGQRELSVVEGEKMLAKLRKLASFSFLSVIGVVALSQAQAAEKTLHAFQGGNDGQFPMAALHPGSDGNFYGITAGGGGSTRCSDGNNGCGTIFSLTAQGVEAVLYAFQGGSDGGYPRSRLVADSAGTFYGTSDYGTANQGTVFKFAPGGSESVLYSFTGGADGGGPQGDLVIDGNGNLYGVTDFGGNVSCLSGQGCGTVFRISPAGSETTLYQFLGEMTGYNLLAE